MSIIELDYYEYSSNGLIQAKYVTSDTYDSYTKLVSHFDGDDGATSFTDPVAGAYTFYGTAQLDTAQSVFENASLLLDGNSDYVSLPDSDNWYFGTGNFTVDFWVKWADVSDWADFIGQRVDDNNMWVLYKCNAPNGHKLTMNFISGGVWRGNYQMTGNWSPSTNTWYHLAFVRNGSSAYIFVNGVAQTITTYTSFSTNDVGNLSVSLSIGHVLSYVNGWIDEFRISKGIARWTSNFTPPTSPYSPSTNNLLAYSESTIKTQGSYSLKGIAAQTDSLNKTLTRTISSPIDLSGKNTVKFDARASRTGSNIKVGLHDSGGTTTEITPNIVSADTFQEVVLDISAVSDENKNAIDKIILTIENADAANTFYIDNMYGDTSLIKKVINVVKSSILKISGIAIASIKKISGVSN